MVTTESHSDRYLTLFSNGAHDSSADTTEDKGGGGKGFRPHDLLEAALATCLSMEVRIHADRNAIPLEEVRTSVTLDRGTPGTSLFRYSIDLGGPISDEQRETLLGVADKCSVHRTLSANIRFQRDG
jgi:putative redox protein